MGRPRPSDDSPETGHAPPDAQQGGAHVEAHLQSPVNHAAWSDGSSSSSPVGSGMPASYPPRQPEAATYPPPPSPYPPPQQYPPEPELNPPKEGVGAPWSTGLFDCHEHDTSAIVTAFFPCVTFGQIAEILDEGQMSCTMGSILYLLMAPALCTCFILGSSYRAKLRQRYDLVQAPAEDWTLHLFCPCCSLCQEFRELKNRGIDPSLGYMGNLALQRQTSIVPPQRQSMDL